MNYHVKCKSALEIYALSTFFKAQGWNVCLLGNHWQDANSCIKQFPVFTIDSKKKRTSGVNAEETSRFSKEVSFEEIMEKGLEAVPDTLASIEVKLNGEYTAIVSEGGIEVGCQNFPLTIIDELVKARKKILSSSVT
jgi:hypothetical protein